jgi:hypothetical protein
MQSIRLHVDGQGMVWVMSKCRGCGEVDKHLASDAIAHAIACRKCGRNMDMTGATIEAVESAGTKVPPGN